MRNRLVAGFVGGVLIAVAAAASAEPPPGSTGVEVAGREGEPPKRWTLTDKATKKVVAEVKDTWGFAAAPAGTYALSILPKGHEAVAAPWGDVVVEGGNVVRVDASSGVEVLGRSDDEKVLDRWVVVDRSGAKVASSWHRWGFTPLPPGTYELRVEPTGHDALEVRWDAVTVAAGKATTVRIDSGVETSPRRVGDPVLDFWDLLDAKSGKRVAHVWHQWGFTPVPPGTYALRLRPTGHDALEIPWGEVTVAAHETTKVALSSGLEVTGRGEDAEKLEHWDVVDRATRKPVAHVWRDWGFVPLPPGAYALRVKPYGHQSIEIPWADVDVGPGEPKQIRIDSGVDLRGREGREPPEFWFVRDPKTKAELARVYRRFGFTPLPPGRYDVFCAPRRVPDVDVGPGSVVAIEEPPPAARWATLSGAGRKTERERDPEGYGKLEEQVELAVRRAAAYVKTQRWITHMDPAEADGHPALGILALVHAGELERDPALARRCRDYLLRRSLNHHHGTYITGLVAMATGDLGALRHQDRLVECATWLLENQGWGDDPKKVWGYGATVPGLDAKPPEAVRRARAGLRSREVVRQGLVVDANDGWDNSNAQFGVLGLHAAARGRIGIPKESWKRVEEHFRATQGGDGGWGYSTGGETGSMTCAGVACLVLARHHQGVKDAAVDPAVLDGLDWLAWRFTVEENPGAGGGTSWHYYYLYGLERVGVLAGTEFFGEHEWYPTGARWLLSQQAGDGSWGKDPFADTCYAILFLRRATLPLETEPPAIVSVSRDEAAMRRDMPSVELVLDCSGSMKDPVDGRPKMAVAREVITEVLAALPAQMQVGLRLYGHKQPPQKTDTELVVPIGPLDDARRKTIQGWIDRAQARGWTPMVHSLLQAKDDFASAGKGTKTVVLVSDGEETGGGKVSDVETAYRAAGIDVVIHVVGFDVQGIPLAQQQMKELARIGKGRYYAAKDTASLAAALREAMPTPGFEVLDAEGKVVARGAVNGDPVEVKPGAYKVRLSAPSAEALDLTLESGQEAPLRADDAGRLAPEGG